jgi:hypothetical protein
MPARTTPLANSRGISTLWDHSPQARLLEAEYEDSVERANRVSNRGANKWVRGTVLRTR